jgi:hypothetical protein
MNGLRADQACTAHTIACTAAACLGAKEPLLAELQHKCKELPQREIVHPSRPNIAAFEAIDANCFIASVPGHPANFWLAAGCAAAERRLRPRPCPARHRTNTAKYVQPNFHITTNSAQMIILLIRTATHPQAAAATQPKHCLQEQ